MLNRTLRITRLLAVGLSSLLLTTVFLAAPRAASATSDSEIPGIPLPSGRVTSNVGGATVDRVYSVEVLSGSVVIATLTGTPGAELGLYLFGSSATSVLTDPAIASSAKPGGSQGISVTLRTAGTYYFNVNGRNTDRAYGFTLTTVIRRDTTPPIITLASPVSPSRSSTVCVRVTASDGLSSATEVALTLPGGSLTEDSWQQYRGSGRYCAAFVLSEGAHQVILHVRNGAGLITSTKQLSLVIDDSAPTLRSTSPTSEGLLLAPRGSIRWNFSEAVRLSGSAASAVYAFDQSGRAIAGSARLTPSGTSVIWTPAVAIPAGAVLLATLGQVTDIAGNIQDAVPTVVLNRKRATTLNLQLVRRTASALQVRLTASGGVVGGTLYVDRRESGAWVQLREFVVGASTSTLKILIGGADRVRVRYEGSDTLAPSVSNVIRVTR